MGACQSIQKKDVKAADYHKKEKKVFKMEIAFRTGTKVSYIEN